MVDDIVRHPQKWGRGLANLVTVALEDRISALTTKDPNKLKVYSGYRQFDLTINGVTHRICEEDVVSYDGQQLTGIELYEKLQSGGGEC